jgi:cytochrome c-type biogenesis protein CcmH/NrfG
VPDAPEEMAQGVACLRQRLAAPGLDAGDRARLLGLLGTYSRTLGDLEGARAALEEAVVLCGERGDARGLLANRIRLAHVYQWQRQFARADAIFDQVIKECEERPEASRYLAVACQHAGKSKFDQGRYAEAAALFARALALRQASGAPDLIASSRLALDTARARLATAGC